MSEYNVKLSGPQSTIIKDPNRFRIVVAGRRFGKSYLCIIELLLKAKKPESLIYYIAPTYKSAKNILWNEIKRITPKEWVRKINEVELTITLYNKSIIRLVGSDNYDSLRGVSLSFAVLDEFAFMKQQVWTEAIRPALSDQEGGALFISTPCGMNWAYDMYSAAKSAPHWNSYQYTTIQGGNVSRKEIEAAKTELSERTFRQEYLASFETLGNRCYYAFDRSIHVTDDLYFDTNDIHIGMDFNVNPMSAVVCTTPGNQIHVIDEIIIENSNTMEMAQEIKNRYANKNIYVYPDPSGNARKTSANQNVTDFSILRDFGFHIISPRSHPSVEQSMENVNRLLKNSIGDVTTYINSKCLHLIKCFEGLTYKAGGSRLPDKTLGLDHAPDAFRYFCWQHMPPQSERVQLDVRIF